MANRNLSDPRCHKWRFLSHESKRQTDFAIRDAYSRFVREHGFHTNFHDIKMMAEEVHKTVEKQGIMITKIALQNRIRCKIVALYHQETERDNRGNRQGKALEGMTLHQKLNLDAQLLEILTK